MFRTAFLLIVSGYLATAAVCAQPPADSGDDPPVLLKKKTAPQPADAPKPDADKKDKEKKKTDDAPKPEADKGVQPETRPDAEEVLKRVAKNMHMIEDRLAKKQLGDATRQAQDDALKDLDSLIDLSENPPPSPDDKNDSSSQPDPSKSSASKSGSSGSSPESGSPGQGKNQGKGKGKSRASRTGRGHGQGSQQPGAGGRSSADKQPGGKQPAGDPGNSKGADDGKESAMTKDHNADLYKDVWGHLPETLRAEMNAYSNTKGFMPEYEALISKYYRTIAEQGRRKGD